MTTLARTVLAFVSLLHVCGLSIAQTPFAASTNQREMAELRRDVKALKDAVATMKPDVAASKEILAETDVAALKKGLDETGWKALDFASQVASTQWTMFGTGLAIVGLIVTVAALGAYQGLAISLEARLNEGIEKEEVRLQQEMNKRVAGIKEMMENTRQSVQGRMYASISYAFWEQANRTTGATKAELDEKRRNLETAIHLARLGRECAIKAGTDSLEDEDLLTHLQGNMAYFIAEFANFAKKHSRFKGLLSDKDRDDALEMANQVQAKARKAIAADRNPDAPEWLENACWAFWNLGEEGDKRSARKALRELYEHPKASPAMTAWIRERYFENKEPTWS